MLAADKGSNIADGGFFSCIRLWLSIVERRAVCEKTEPHLPWIQLTLHY